uniref:Very-long-chain (3R)-3-hydroxyacyl-CoA dehydratase n=1 Tax=Globodera pallida TaxID=36090 RepID=A0A183BSY3_GLOPA
MYSNPPELADDASTVNTEKASRAVWLVKVPRYLRGLGAKRARRAATVDARQPRENSNSTQIHKIVHSLVGLVRSPVFTTLVQIVHSLVGLVRSPVFTTLVQVFSRVTVLWLILDIIETNIYAQR